MRCENTTFILVNNLEIIVTCQIIYRYFYLSNCLTVKGDEGSKCGTKMKSRINVGNDISTDETDTDLDKHGKEEKTINYHDQHSLKSVTKTIHCKRIKTKYKLKETKGNLLFTMLM